MIKEILLTLFYLLLFNFLIYRFKKIQFRNFRPWITYLLFNLKFLTGIFIWVIYSFYYKDVQNNDVHKFYNDALVLRGIAQTEEPKVFWAFMAGQEEKLLKNPEKYSSAMRNWNRNFDEAPFNENHTIIKLNALLLFVSFKTYSVHILFFCFISLMGWILLTNSILSFADERNAILTLPVLFLPSILFWTSGVMKEPLLVLGLGLLIAAILNLGLGIRNLKTLVAFALGVIVVLFTKFFVLACLAPALIAYLLFKKTGSLVLVLLKYIATTTALLFIALNIHYLVPQINLQQMLVNKQTHSVKEAEYFKAGSRIEIPELKPDALSILKNIPVGIWNTLFRPYLSDAKNVMMLASAIENFIVISFLVMFLAGINWQNPRNLNLFLFLLTFSLAYFALVGMCTPVLGNLVRYKTPLLPLFMFAFVVKISPKAVADSLTFVLRK
jgi:hypothetical protein